VQAPESRAITTRGGEVEATDRSDLITAQLPKGHLKPARSPRPVIQPLVTKSGLQ